VPPRAISADRWEALCRTAAAVRSGPGGRPAAPRHRRRRRSGGRALLAGALLGAAVFAVGHLHGQPAAADATADADLFALTNQDRASNGVPALVQNSTLSSIGEAAPYSGCSGAGTIDGRAQDMINRDYFAHLIPPCNQLVWSMMSAFGVDYDSAGENIGWESGYGDGSASANQVNTDFMNSTDHRENILNPKYTDLGIGSATTASGQSWTFPGATGGPYSDVWIFAEEFAQLPSSSAPPPTANPTPTPTPAPATAPPVSTPVPVRTPSATPVPTPTPTPTSTPTPTPSPTPTATATPSLAPGLPLPTYDVRGQGLISDTIESTLEAFLFD